VKHLKSLFFIAFCSVGALHSAKIALCVMATGKYLAYAERLIASARTHFCKEHEVFYFVFTDGQIQDTGADIVRIEQKRLGWPYDTMMRFHAYYGVRELLQEMDYIYATDADMLFVNTVGDEIFSDLVGTLHPGYVGKRGTPETRKISKAFVPMRKRKRYFCGGFYGGKSQRVLELLKTAIENVDDDLSRGIVAVWHDESHLNCYFTKHKPTLILTPSYCYVYEYNLPYVPRLVALTKNHAELRT